MGAFGRRLRRACLAATLLLGALAGAEEPVVVLLSWDGVRHDYVDRGGLPGLERMARDGVRAERLRPVFPTNTFPNHVSLATGASTEVHGIVGNVFRDAERGAFDYESDASWIEAEPLWAAAERQGLRAATFFWVGSETDWRGVGASVRMTPFDSGISESAKAEQILAWLDLSADERPRLILSWWHGADSVGHRSGPDDPSVNKQMRAQDLSLARLLGGLDTRRAWGWVTLVVVSDHGMAQVSEGIDLGGHLARAGIAARVIPGGGVALVHLRDRGRRDEALDAIAALPRVRAYASDALPTALRYNRPGRTGDLVALADPPLAFFPPTALRKFGAQTTRVSGLRRGGHGYAADHPDMSGIFLAIGRGVPPGLTLGEVRAIDVAPTVARLLSMQPPRQAEGRPIPGIAGALRDARRPALPTASETRARSPSATDRAGASPD